MERIKSCGVLLFRSEPKRSFLLMRHADRWDLPKGHVDQGETETQCALRELWEETGIEANAIRIDPQFRYTLEYQVPWRDAGQATGGVPRRVNEAGGNQADRASGLPVVRMESAASDSGTNDRRSPRGRGEDELTVGWVAPAR